MSHGPLGLGGAGRPAPDCWAIVSVTPIRVSAAARMSARWILVFMLVLFALPVLFGSFRPSSVYIQWLLPDWQSPLAIGVVLRTDGLPIARQDCRGDTDQYSRGNRTLTTAVEVYG